jgi:hypothetical protein
MRTSVLLFALLLSAGCSSAEPADVRCRVGADCVSGMCKSDGTCAPPSTGGDAEAGVDAVEETTPDDDASEEPDAPDEGSSQVCSPNHDGTIERGEVPLAAGLHATFLIAENATVDTTGADVNGTTQWDFTSDLPGDTLTLVELKDLTGEWFAADYPEASYASLLADGYLGVFQITDDQLLLHAVVSKEGGATRTQLNYKPPAVMLQFPLTVGATWTSTSQISGVTLGVISAATEKYESQIDKAGEVKTPFSTFPVLRINTVLTRTVNMVPYTMRSFLFVTECFGTVASVSSNTGEQTVEFTKASEVKRMAK